MLQSTRTLTTGVKEGDLLERYIIFGFGRREITPEEIEEYKAFIKSLREKEAAEKASIDKLISSIKVPPRDVFEPLKELPKVLEKKHWTPNNWKPKVKNFNNINPNFLKKSRNRW